MSRPPEPFIERETSWIAPTFLLRTVEYGATPKHSLVFISDLHWPTTAPEAYQALAPAINALQPEWLISGGDLHTFLSGQDEALEWFASLKATRGHLAVQGNREAGILWKSHERKCREYADHGVTLLCNKMLEAEGIRFYGVDDARHGKPEWPASLAKPGAFTITISHNPDAVADTAPGTPIGDLALCGHTHGGQFLLPAMGALYSSSAYGRQFLKGWQRRSDGALCFITQGIGEAGQGWVKRRFRIPREILLLRF